MMKIPALNTVIMPRQSFGEALVELAESYPKLRVFDADVCTSTQTHFFRDQYPSRFYQMGIAESNMVGAAAGMATTGLIPFVSTFSVFLAKRAIDQIRVSIAYPGLNVKLNGAYAGLPTGKAGATHSSLQDIAIMRCMPNMKVLVPGDPLETKLAVNLALQTPGPVYLRTVRCPVPVIFSENHKLEFGKAQILHEGNDAALISTGMMTPKALEAADILERKGIHIRLIHMPSIKPADEEAIIAASRECGKIVTVENHSIHGGLGGLVAEVTSLKAPCPVYRMGFPDIFMESGDNEAIFSKLRMNTHDIVSQIRLIS